MLVAQALLTDVTVQSLQRQRPRIQPFVHHFRRCRRRRRTSGVIGVGGFAGISRVRRAVRALRIRLLC